jgi:serine/threonine protein phosphatase PrpC
MEQSFIAANAIVENTTHQSRAPLWSSSAATRCSPRRAVNEDCFVQIEEAGFFVVADGVGGHTDGDLASRAVIETLGCVVAPNTPLDARVVDAERALHSVNTVLWREAQTRPQPTLIASTVAALILSKGYAACLWAGDSRVYVYRAGHLYQLTLDHNVAAENDLAPHGDALTRAIGAAETLELGRLVTPIEPGDIFLVCSDGVTKFVDDVEIAHFLVDPPDGLATRIVAAVVERDGNDDATAIVVRYVGDQSGLSANGAS